MTPLAARLLSVLCVTLYVVGGVAARGDAADCLLVVCGGSLAALGVIVAPEVSS